MDKISVMGIEFDNIGMDGALDVCKNWLGEENEVPRVIHTPNSEIVELCIENNEKYEVFNSADLVIPDGSGVVLAAKILGTPIDKGKVAGVELSEHIIEYCAKSGLGVFILGGKPGVADVAAKKLCEKYAGLVISGTHDGYFKDDAAVIDEINASGAAFLAVCMGVPRQEEWIFENKKRLNVKLVGGFGGSVDIFAGTAKRAPKIFIKLGLEWFYRLLREPARIGRMMNLPKFLFKVIAYKFRAKK